jgi:hypothetical protein
MSNKPNKNERRECLDTIEARIRAVECDLREPLTGNDKEFQADKLCVIADDLSKYNTLVHGSGTGRS